MGKKRDLGVFECGERVASDRSESFFPGTFTTSQQSLLFTENGPL